MVRHFRSSSRGHAWAMFTSYISSARVFGLLVLAVSVFFTKAMMSEVEHHQNKTWVQILALSLLCPHHTQIMKPLWALAFLK